MEGMGTMSNRVKQKLIAGQAVLGCLIPFYAPTVVEMLGYAGFEFLVIDHEHGCFSLDDIENLIRAAEVADLLPLVRVDYDPSTIQKVLDRGARGIQVPMVNNREDAEKVIQKAKFPPVGQRGTSYSVRAARHGRLGGNEYLTAADADTIIAVHIETPEAVANFEEIVTVPGIDVAFLGPLDLAVNMGYKEEGPRHPEVQRVLANLYAKAHDLGVSVGTVAGSAADVDKVMDAGATYILGVGTSILNQAFNEIVTVKTMAEGKKQ